MNLLKKTGIIVVVYLLVACGDSGSLESDTTARVQREKEVNTGRASPHTIQGMKNVMDDARSVEDMLQKHNEEQRKEIDSYRK